MNIFGFTAFKLSDVLFSVNITTQQEMNQVLVIGDSHLCRINKHELHNNVGVAAASKQEA